MEISNDDTEAGNCIICLESPANVVFHPCTHCVTCEECSSRVKKCLTCRQVVLSKVTQGNGSIFYCAIIERDWKG